MQLFISYARADRSQAESLAERLRQAGIAVWLDSDLMGGQEWWDRILDRLRACDVVIAAMSWASLRSQACRAEREYAAKLGKAILPLTFESLESEMLPADIARIQAIDYSKPDETAAFKLIGAIYAVEKPAGLPSPLPSPPDVPESYFTNIVDRISAPTLDLDEQLAIIGRLEGALVPSADPHDMLVATELLSQMAARSDLFATPARQIENLQAKIRMDRIGAASQSTSPADAGVPGQQAVPITVSPHWGLAITTAVFTFLTILLCPIGIMALINASRAQKSARAGDLAGARKASKRVVILFWIMLGLFIILGIIGSLTDSSSSTGASSSVTGYSILS